MSKLKRILVATDNSAQARWAECRGTMLGVELNVDLLEIMSLPKALGVPSCPLAIRNARATPPVTVDSLSRESTLAHPTTPIVLQPVRTQSAASSKPVAAIVDRANTLEADLTVVAARKNNSISALFTGQTNSELVRQSDRPILLVTSRPRSAYAKIVVAIDFSEHSRDAALTALALAPSAYFNFLNACHVTNEGIMREAGITSEVINAYRVKACENARTRLNQFIDDLGPRRELIARAIQYGFPVPVICDRAKRLGADLIVIGKHGTSRFHDFLLGSVTQRLIDHTGCDLLVVSTPRHISRERPQQLKRAERNLEAANAGSYVSVDSSGKYYE